MFNIKSIFKFTCLGVLLGFFSFLEARTINTFYGPLEVQEPLLLELIDSPIFQRLKSIHQYGVAYYITHPEEYSRYDHSIGVFALLRAKGAPFEEQVAGLLHDVSHTAFSHVGDWVFGKVDKEYSYQDDIHAHFLEESGLGDILKKYNLTIEQIMPEENLFPALESSLPNLSADRIDYNIQGAYHQGFITYDEAIEIFCDLQFKEGKWISTKQQLMKKLASFSCYMTLTCWGSAANYVSSRDLADAILRLIELGTISHFSFHFGTDQEIWDKLLTHSDPYVKEKMQKVMKPYSYFRLVEASQADLVVKSKFRGIDPWIVSGSTCMRLSSLDPDFANEYEKAKQTLSHGWYIRYIQP